MTERCKTGAFSARLHDHQRIHDRIFQSARDISASLFVVADTLRMVLAAKGFQTGKLNPAPDDQVVIGRGKTKRPHVLRRHFSATSGRRIIQPQQFGSFYQTLRRRQVNRLASSSY